MRKLLTTAVASLTLFGGLATATVAVADDDRGYRRHGGYNNGYYNRGYGNHYRGNRGGDQAVAAIAGGLLGYALGSATSGPRYYAPPPRYYAPTYYAPQYYAPPRYYAPPPRYYAPRHYYRGGHGYGRPCYNGYC